MGVGRLSPLREREFRLLFLGRVVSTLGSAIAPVALAFAVLRLTGSKGDLGLILAARQLPQIVFLLLGGVFGDRLARHRVMVVSSVISGASQGGVATLLLTGHAHVWSLAALSAVNGSASAFFSPASAGVVPQTVSALQLQSANALLRLSFNMAAIVGPALGGIFVAALNPGWALALDAISFALGAVFIGLMRTPANLRMASSTILDDLRDGWSEFRSRTWLWAIVLQFSIVNAVVMGSINVLGAAQAERHLGGATAYGAILAAMAAGFFTAGLIALRFRPNRLLLVATYAVFPAALPPLLFAFPAPTPAIAAGAFLMGFGFETFEILWTVAMQQRIPQEVLSRVSSYDMLGSWVLMPVALALAGPISTLIGTRTTLLASAGLVILATAPVLGVRDVRYLQRQTIDPPEADLESASTQPAVAPSLLESDLAS